MLSILGRFWVTVSCNRAPILTRRIVSVPGVCERVSLDDSWALRPVVNSQLLKRVRSICGVPTIVSLATYYSSIASEMSAPKGRQHQARIDQSVPSP